MICTMSCSSHYTYIPRTSRYICIMQLIDSLCDTHSRRVILFVLKEPVFVLVQ